MLVKFRFSWLPVTRRPVLFASILLGLATPAFAYIDPGAGSLILQLLIGGVAGSLLAIRLFWRRLSVWWRSRKDPTAASR